MLVSPGRFEFITGPMFAGKTDDLIRRVRRAMHAGLKIQVINPSIDKRYGVNCVSTHDKIKIKSNSVKDIQNLDSILDMEKDGFAFDEIQFFSSEIVEYISNLRKNGKLIFASGLNMDYVGKAFTFKDSDRYVGELMSMADNITYLTAICKYPLEIGKVCGAEATRTQRLVKDDHLILVGGEKEYGARCEQHHTVN